MTASTRCDMRGSAGEVKNAIAASASAIGTRNQNGLPEVGDVTEDPDQPLRHALRHGDGAGVNEGHRRRDDRGKNDGADAEPKRLAPYRRGREPWLALKVREIPGRIAAYPLCARHRRFGWHVGEAAVHVHDGSAER